MHGFVESLFLSSFKRKIGLLASTPKSTLSLPVVEMI